MKGNALKASASGAGADARAARQARFPAERKALRKVQVHFEFQQALMQRVRMAAAAENLSYADYVRKLVGLPYAKIQRPRISLSFGEQDLALLAERYREPAADPSVLKRRVMDEVGRQFQHETGDVAQDG